MMPGADRVSLLLVLIQMGDWCGIDKSYCATSRERKNGGLISVTLFYLRFK